MTKRMKKPRTPEVLQLSDIPDMREFVDNISDERLATLSFALPMTLGEKPAVDEDGFLVGPGGSIFDFTDYAQLQTACWNKFVKNPQINSYVRDVMGRMTGYGFATYSDIEKINTEIENTHDDPRNALYTNMSKYVARSEIEGELFLALTAHSDGFVEITFMEPSTLGKCGTDGCGITYHPFKSTMPLMYYFTVKDASGQSQTYPIPSINLAHYPDYIKFVKNDPTFKQCQGNLPKKSGKKHKELGGFDTFIVAWDRSFITRRNVSHIRTTIEWLNHYEALKKYEIDHKKSSGAYLWVAQIEDPKAYRTWLSLSDEQREKSGLLQKKTPGGTLVLPPGMKMSCVNPQLSKISDQDTDIMQMVISGLNRPEDMVTGSTSGSTFSGVKASRGPQSDRAKDDIAYFERFLVMSLWRSVFLLKKHTMNFPETFKVTEAVAFDDKQEPVTKEVEKPIYKLIYCAFPTSEVSDMEGLAKGLLGVKHASLIDTLGIPRDEVARRLGFPGYAKMRLRHATEDFLYPPLISTLNAEAFQEATQTEPAPAGAESAGTKKADTKAPAAKPKIPPKKGAQKK